MGATDADSAGAAEPATLDVAEMLAAARDPDPDVQAARLREWACSDDAPLMLDMRSADDFAAARLDGAVNIPFEDLDGRLHELPPRSKPLAVVLARAPSPEEQARVFAADFKGLPWRVRAFFLPTHHSSTLRSRRRRRRSFGRGPPARQRTPVGTLRYGRTLAPPPRGPHGPRLERRSAPRGARPRRPRPRPRPRPQPATSRTRPRGLCAWTWGAAREGTRCGRR